MTIAKVFILCLLLTFILAGCAGKTEIDKPGSPPSSSPQPVVSSSADVVKVTASELTLVGNGARGEAVITITILPGFHINANPATFPYLIATELRPTNRKGIIAGTPIYPVGVKRKFQFADQPLAVYEGTIEIKLPFTADATAARGPDHLPMDLVVQACDQEQCFAPVAKDVTVAINVK